MGLLFKWISIYIGSVMFILVCEFLELKKNSLWKEKSSDGQNQQYRTYKTWDGKARL